MNELQIGIQRSQICDSSVRLQRSISITIAITRGVVYCSQFATACHLVFQARPIRHVVLINIFVSQKPCVNAKTKGLDMARRHGKDTFSDDGVAAIALPSFIAFSKSGETMDIGRSITGTHILVQRWIEWSTSQTHRYKVILPISALASILCKSAFVS